MLRTLEGSALCSVLADRVKEYFKDEENRKDENLQWYWLMNKVRESAAGFALVSYGGNADRYNASFSNGVRPAFKIKNR